MTVPDLSEEIIAFRAWQIRPSWERHAELLSMNRTPWPGDDWLVAECVRAGCETPGENCTCGIYAARHRRHLVELGYNAHRELIAIGEVGLAGKVIPGTQGWRAAKARVIRLWVPYVHWRLVEPLRATYRVPVGLSNTLRGS